MKVFYNRMILGVIERTEELKDFLKEKFRREEEGIIMGCKEFYPIWAEWYEEINDGEITTYTLDPQAFGFTPCKKSDLMGGDAKINAGITYDILSGKEQGAKRDAVVLNSGLSLYLGGKGSIKECIELARITLDNGKALQKLQQLIVLSNG